MKSFYAGTEIPPKAGDRVMWIENHEEWEVTQEDLEGPAALKHWPDGGWCNVVLLERP